MYHKKSSPYLLSLFFGVVVAPAVQVAVAAVVQVVDAPGFADAPAVAVAALTILRAEHQLLLGSWHLLQQKNQALSPVQPF